MNAYIITKIIRHLAYTKVKEGKKHLQLLNT